MQNRHYQAGVTLWKAFWAFVQATLGVGAAVAAIEPPETVDDFTAKWPVLVIPLALAIWRAVENYRKNAGPVAGVPRWDWPWKKPVCILLCLAIFGCATNSAKFHEVITAADGTVTETSFEQSTAVTVGSKATEGSGSMAYDWTADGDGSLAVGNAAKDMQAGDGVEQLQAILNAAPILLPLMQAMRQPAAQPEAE